MTTPNETNGFMTREEEQSRWEQIPQPIRHIARDNPLVHDILKRYALGIIITKEEALCQMIVGLGRDWEKQKADYIQLARLSPGCLSFREWAH